MRTDTLTIVREMAPDEIRIRRTEAKLSVADLASIFRCHTRTIERWESGETKPNAAEMIALDTIFSEKERAKPARRTTRKSNSR